MAYAYAETSNKTMFSIIVAVLFVIKIYSNYVHSFPNYIGSHYGKEKKKLLRRVEDAKRKVIRHKEAIKLIRKCLLHNLNPKFVRFKLCRDSASRSKAAVNFRRTLIMLIS